MVESSYKNSSDTGLVIKLQTQMRSGTHFMLNALSRVYHLKPAIINRDGGFNYVDKNRLAKGLYKHDNKSYPTNNGTVLQYHFYHKVNPDLHLEDAKLINLIGYPFDTYYSDGLIYSTENYTVAPTRQHQDYKDYKLKFGSPEWLKLEERMIQNAEWLESLENTNEGLTIKYEDLFLDNRNILNQIEEYLGPFKEEFPEAVKNPERVFWTDNYREKFDDHAIKNLTAIFRSSISKFYPEKLDSLSTRNNSIEQERISV